jgi:hypothetical protein
MKTAAALPRTITLAEAAPGDIVAFETKGFFGRLIQLGQWLRRKDRSDRRFHHIAVLREQIPNTPDPADPKNWVVVQAAKRVDRAYVDAVAGGRPYVVLSCPPGVNRELVLAEADAQLGAEYGVLTIVSIAFNVLTPFRIGLRADATWICSALGAWCLHRGGWGQQWPDVYSVTPADLVGALTA